MPAKIRLQRQGRKFQAIYSIVVSDSRAPRDGKFIESLGQYNPNTNPATIILDFNKALEWLQKGAQPTDTCRAILSYKGVLYKKHLLEGVKKGAFDEAEAEKRFQAWMTEKEQKIQAKKDQLKASHDKLQKNRIEEETKIKEARAEEISKKRSEIIEKETAAAAGEAEEAETPVEPTEGTESAEAPAEEEAAAETPAEEEAAAEAPAEEEAAAEAPAEEEVSEETPAEETEEAAEIKAETEEPEASGEETPEAEEEAEEEPKKEK